MSITQQLAKRKMPHILKLDGDGIPDKWITPLKAVHYHSRGKVAWGYGDEFMRVYGGINRMTGEQTVIETNSIIAIKFDRHSVNHDKKRKSREINLTNENLFIRDQHVCAYCGETFKFSDLSRDHVYPTSKGGPDIWENVVTSCWWCNNKKGDKLHADLGMDLLYIPYRPTRAEFLVLQNSNILSDQSEYLMGFIDEYSHLKKGAG